MTSTEYLLWLVVMAILIPAIVHGGTTWAYFRGSRDRRAIPAAPLRSASRTTAEQPGEHLCATDDR